ncbi:MAG: amino acid permease [Acidobacteria bacterium]|nr:amino acid permease [Acidobacteriota bacterium]
MAETIVVASDVRAARGPTLRRALGRWDLTAIGINQVIGSAVFLLPSQVAAQVGGWGPVAFLAVGAASLLVALCFAELASRFEQTGGPYLYARAAFGRFAAFEIGWMQWIARITSQAGIANGIALALGFYWPSLTDGAGRVAVIAGVTLVIGWINLLGIRPSAFVVNLLTFAKLLPLGLFIIVGMWFIEPGALVPSGPVSASQASAGALLLVFAFGGYDVIGVPAGEAIDPRRHIPFAFVATIVAVTAVMTLAHIVAAGTLPALAVSTTPLADAAVVFMGAGGALLISIGSVVSMAGNSFGSVLTGSRMLFAMAEHGDLPRVLARIHPRYRTPSHAVLAMTAVTLTLALSGSFVVLALASGVARLVIYMGTCAAALRLRSTPAPATGPAPFVSPGGPLVPVLAIAMSLAILAGATWGQLLGGAAGLAAGAVLFGTGRLLQLDRRQERGLGAR